MYKELPDENLVKLISQGHKQALEVLYDRYFDRLVKFANSYLFDETKAEDIAQESFIKLIEKHEYFDYSRKFSTWFYTLTGNLCKQTLRNDKNRLRILKEEVMTGMPETGIMYIESDRKILSQKISTIYNCLSEKEKNIYTLRFENELSIKEIADILNIPEGSVKSGVFYLLKKFAHHLKDFTNEK